MSRNGSGTYSLPSNSWNPATNGTPATAADWQTLINDVAAALTQSLSKDGQTPLTGNLAAGGNKVTGLAAGASTGDSLRFEQLFSQGALTDIASSTTTDIGAQLSTMLRVTGTTTITGFGTNYNGPRFLIFVGAVTLTHSATLVLPGAANITTAENDALIALPISGGWQVVAYQRASGDIDAKSVNGGQLAGLRNRIINGNFGVNQRSYVSGAAVGTVLYGHDRWKMAASADTYTFSTTDNVTTVTIPASKVLRQVIEGLNLESGTYTLSWTGTAQGKIGAGSYGASGITGVIVGGTNTTIEFGPGTVSKVQLEFGSTATVFEQRPFGMELALCQRYFYSYESGSSGIGEFGIGYLRSTTSFLFSVKYPVAMRAAPTALAFSGVVGNYAYQVGGTTCAATAISAVVFGPESSTVEFTSGTASTVGFGGRAYASGGTRYLQFSAEL